MYECCICIAKVLYNEALYSHELNSASSGNQGPRDPKSGALSTQPPGGLCLDGAMCKLK